MKKPWKITIVSICSIVGAILIAASVAIWFVFTPQKLTPMVKSMLDKNITCESNLKEVELTFFSTFPSFGIEIDDLLLKNRIDDSCSDTLLNVPRLVGKINLVKYILKNELEIDDITLNNGVINLYTDTLGQTNYDVFLLDSTKKRDEKKFSMPFDEVELKNLLIKQAKISYADYKNGTRAEVENADINLKAEVEDYDGGIELTVDCKNIRLNIEDSSKMEASTPRLQIKIDGEKNENEFEGNIYTNIENLTFINKGNTLVDNQNIDVKLPFAGDLAKMEIEIKNAFFNHSNNKINLNGKLKKTLKNIGVNLNFDTDFLDIKSVIEILPSNIKSSFKDMTFGGKMGLKGVVEGEVGKSVMPLVTAELQVENGEYRAKNMPDYPIGNINGRVAVNLNLNDSTASSVTIDNMALTSRNSKVNLNATVKDLMNQMIFDVSLKGNIDLADAQPMMSKTMSVKGKSATVAQATFKLNDLIKTDLKKIKLKAKLNTKELNCTYNDSSIISANQAVVDVQIPSSKKTAQFSELLQVLVLSPQIDCEMVGTMQATINKPEFDIGVSDIMNKNLPPGFRITYKAEDINVKKDTISAKFAFAKGNFVMANSKNNAEQTEYFIFLNSENLNAYLSKDLTLKTSSFRLSGKATNDKTQDNTFLQWNPNFGVKIDNVTADIKNNNHNAYIPFVDIDLTPKKLVINKSRVVIDNSDFNLSGIVTNIDNYFRNDGMLQANVDFTSDKLDVLELMEIVSGFGAKDSIQKSALQEKSLDSEKDPFMVPWNVDVTVNTNVSHGKVGQTDFYDLGGKLVVKDGVMVLEQMGFTFEAAKMQLSAIYRSERKNHLFAGVDFHLLDINFAKLIEMIPQIDTIVPMLKYFDGNGEFHIAGETYLKSNYDFKYSTIRGASAIVGKNLVIKPNKMMDEMMKGLKLLNIKPEVDSLDVELSVFRNEVELYPFLLNLGKYKLVMQGNYNYSTGYQSATNYKGYAEMLSPLRLGFNVRSNDRGELQKLNFFKDLKLFNLQYGHFLKPSKQSAVEKQIMEFKKLIYDSLKANVK